MPNTSLSREGVPAARSTAAGRLRPRFGWLNDRPLVWLFLSPTMILLLLIAIFPLIWSLYLSFTRYSVIKDSATGPVWVGLQNYAQLLSNKDIWSRFTTTASFVVPAVAIAWNNLTGRKHDIAGPAARRMEAVPPREEPTTRKRKAV